MLHVIGVRNKEVREAADLQKRGPQGKKFGNLWPRAILRRRYF